MYPIVGADAHFKRFRTNRHWGIEHGRGTHGPWCGAHVALEHLDHWLVDVEGEVDPEGDIDDIADHVPVTWVFQSNLSKVCADVCLIPNLSYESKIVLPSCKCLVDCSLIYFQCSTVTSALEWKKGCVSRGAPDLTSRTLSSRTVMWQKVQR